MRWILDGVMECDMEADGVRESGGLSSEKIWIGKEREVWPMRPGRLAPAHACTVHMPRCNSTNFQCLLCVSDRLCTAGAAFCVVIRAHLPNDVRPAGNCLD